MAPLKLASGCDRRCTFCAIPAFRGSFVSRRPSDVLAEARWLADQGARELFLVSENSTSYGKDLGDLRLLETLLPELAAVDGVERVRVSYLQPAETRPGLVHRDRGDTRAWRRTSTSPSSTPPTPCCAGCAGSATRESFLGLLEQARAQAPEAGARSNFIVGFPGETEHDLEVLCDFLSEARLDAIGIFGYSDEDGTEAEGFDGKLDEDEIAERLAHVTALAEELTAQRAEERVGEGSVVLVESVDETGSSRVAPRTRAPRSTVDHAGGGPAGSPVGDMIQARVVGSEGVDLVAESWSRRARRRGDEPADEPAAAQVSNWNVPNALTTLRIVMVPFFGWALLHDGGQRPHLALGRLRAVLPGDDHRQDRRRPRAQAQPDHRLRQDRRPDRRQGDDRHGVHRPGDHRRLPARLAVVDDRRSWCCCASGAVTVARLSIAKDVVMPAKQSGKVKTMMQVGRAGRVRRARSGCSPGRLEVPGDVLWWLSAVALAVAVVLTITSGLEFARDVVRHRREPAAPCSG